MSNSFGLGEVIVIVFNAFLISIPIIIVWLFFRMLRKISRHSEQIELEVKKLREEIQSMQERMPHDSL